MQGLHCPTKMKATQKHSYPASGSVCVKPSVAGFFLRSPKQAEPGHVGSSGRARG